MDDTARVWDAEMALLDPAVRRDRDAVAALLDERFTEIGQSGRRWSRDEILDALSAEEPVEPFDAVASITEGSARVVAAGLVLLTYRLDFGGRESRRSSLWALDPLRLLFHQGTPLPPDSPVVE